MAVTTFAAIDIGSYEVSMKIFEFSRKIGFRELNDVRYRLEIGKDAYSSGRLDPQMVDSICEDTSGFWEDHERVWSNRLSCLCNQCIPGNDQSFDRAGTDLPENPDPGGDLK